MKITNKLGLPQPLVDAVKNDGYSKGDADISATGLLKPPRIAALEALYVGELSEDASDRIWSLFGQAMHTVLERANTDAIAERRLSVKVLEWTISGSMDAYYDHGLLQDYKFVTVYKFKDGGVPKEYEQQLNIYAYILRKHGHAIERLQIVGILRDWSKLEASRDPSYPQSQVVVRDVPLWPAEIAEKFVEARVRVHQEARKELPLCSAEDRWEKPTKWAVMKNGGERAVKLFDTESAAADYATRSAEYFVEKRPGEATRCKAYCSVAQFCTQYGAGSQFAPRNTLKITG